MADNVNGQQFHNWIANERGNLQEHLDRIELINNLPHDDPYRLQCLTIMEDALGQFIQDNPDFCVESGFYGVEIRDNLLQLLPLNGSFLLIWVERHQNDDVEKLKKKINDVNNLPDNDSNKQACVRLLFDVLNQFVTDNPEYCSDIGFYGVGIANDRLYERAPGEEDHDSADDM